MVGNEMREVRGAQIDHHSYLFQSLLMDWKKNHDNLFCKTSIAIKRSNTDKSTWCMGTCAHPCPASCAETLLNATAKRNIVDCSKQSYYYMLELNRKMLRHTHNLRFHF